MQALILAAGMGRRMGKYTDHHTKCMVMVGGKTLLERTIEGLINANIKKLVMVIGYEAENLKNYIASKKFNIEIEYVYNYEYLTTNNIYSLHLAKDLLIQDDTILIESDLIYDKNIILSIVESKEKNLAVVAKYEQWMDGTVVTLNNNNYITDFIDKEHFQYEDVNNYYKTVNIYKFSKEFSENQYIPFLEAYLKAYGVNQYYEQVLKILSHIHHSKLKAYVINTEDWYEIDDAQDLDIANTMFATDRDIIKKYELHFGGYWRFPKLKDFCYLVNPYYPPKKMIDQLKFFLEELLTQYPSGMNIQCLNVSSMLEVDERYLVVGNGAAEIINVLGKYISGKTRIYIPTFNEYSRCFVNCIFDEIDTSIDNYKIDINKVINEIESFDNLILINPDNPSGRFIEYEDIIRVIEACKRYNTLLIIDESFIDFADKEKRYTLIKEDIISRYTNLIVIKSISKSYGVPGLRLGVMATSNLCVLNYVIRELSIWNINSFAEYYLQIQRLYKNTYLSSCDRIAEQRKNMILELSQLEILDIYPSQANYLMCKIKDNIEITASELALNLLKKYNILIKNLYGKKGFKIDKFFRIAIRDEEDNMQLLNAISDIWDNKGKRR